MNRAARIRLYVAVALAVIGLGIGWRATSGAVPDEFDGAVVVIPRDPDVAMGVRVEYVPTTTTSLARAREGRISITASSRDGQDAVTSRWYVLLIGDAQLDNAQVIDDYGDGPARDAPSVRQDAFDVEYQLFELELREGQGLFGDPRRSPLIEVAGRYELTMPNVLSTEPESGWERDGGVVFVEEPWIQLLAGNDWHTPKSVHFLVSGGLRETSAISVVRTTPDVDEERWSDLIIWDTENRPIATSATFVDSRTTIGPDLQLGAAFLFLGASLPLFVEAFVPREETPSRPPKGVGLPPTTPKPMSARPKTRLNRRRRR